jgi:hypothetical protein
MGRESKWEMSNIMKTKAICLGVFGILLVLAVTLWATWSCAYRRGYSRGARDEFACWKQVPVLVSAGTAEPLRGVRYNYATLTGQRDAWLPPGGKKVPQKTIFAPDYNVNDIHSVFP